MSLSALPVNPERRNRKPACAAVGQISQAASAQAATARLEI